MLWGLFCLSFLSATLLPAQSELALSAMLLAGMWPFWLVILVAWLGNTAGSCLNWLLGKFAARHAKTFFVSSGAMARAEGWYKKYGRWSLLLSWAPVIGDPLTLAAGVLGEKFAPFFLLTGAAKLARYLAVAGIAACI